MWRKNRSLWCLGESLRAVCIYTLREMSDTTTWRAFTQCGSELFGQSVSVLALRLLTFSFKKKKKEIGMRCEGRT